MKKIILTGFEPFAHYTYNPTQKSAEDFNGKIFGDREVIGIVLPSIYNAWGHLIRVIKDNDPYAIISTGLSSSVQGMRIESVFRNIMNGKYPDANGDNPKNEPIVDHPLAPRTVKARASSNKLFKLLADNDIPTEFSDDAGDYICNSLGYNISFAARGPFYIQRTLFVHIPWTSEYEGKEGVLLTKEQNFLETDMYYKGLELLIKNI